MMIGGLFRGAAIGATCILCAGPVFAQKSGTGATTTATGLGATGTSTPGAMTGGGLPGTTGAGNAEMLPNNNGLPAGNASGATGNHGANSMGGATNGSNTQ